MKKNWAILVSVFTLTIGMTAACGDGGFSGDTSTSNEGNSDARYDGSQNTNAQPGIGTDQGLRSDLVDGSSGAQIDTGTKAESDKALECTLPEDLQQKIDNLVAQRGTFGGGSADSGEGWGATDDSCVQTYYKVCVQENGVKRCGEYDVATQIGIDARPAQFAECLGFAQTNGAKCEFTRGGFGFGTQ